MNLTDPHTATWIVGGTLLLCGLGYLATCAYVGVSLALEARRERRTKPAPREWSVLVPSEPDDRDEALRTIARHVAAHGTPPGDYMGVVAGERVELIPLDDVRDLPEVGA